MGKSGSRWGIWVIVDLKNGLFRIIEFLVVAMLSISI